MLVFIICVSTYRLSTHKNIVNCAPDRTRTYTPCGHDILSVTRLPISPQAQACPSLRTATTFTSNGRNAVKHTGSVALREESDLNRRITVLQTAPLGHSGIFSFKRGTLQFKILALFYVNYCIKVFYAGLIGCYPNDVDPKNSRRVPTFCR